MSNVSCEQTTGKYTCSANFDLMAWYDELWQNEDDNILNMIGLDIYMKLIAMDANGFVLPEQDQDRGFLIVRRRCDYWQFPATDAVCLFIALLCNRPGKIVMIIAGLMVAWENRALLTLPGVVLNDKADMLWISQHFNEGFQCGSEFIESPSWGFPSEEHFHKMWNKQKCGGSNFLDSIIINNNTEELSND